MTQKRRDLGRTEPNINSRWDWRREERRMVVRVERERIVRWFASSLRLACLNLRLFVQDASNLVDSYQISDKKPRSKFRHAENFLEIPPNWENAIGRSGEAKNELVILLILTVENLRFMATSLLSLFDIIGMIMISEARFSCDKRHSACKHYFYKQNFLNDSSKLRKHDWEIS